MVHFGPHKKKGGGVGWAWLPPFGPTCVFFGGKGPAGVCGAAQKRHFPVFWLRCVVWACSSRPSPLLALRGKVGQLYAKGGCRLASILRTAKGEHRYIWTFNCVMVTSWPLPSIPKEDARGPGEEGSWYGLGWAEGAIGWNGPMQSASTLCMQPLDAYLTPIRPLCCASGGDW